MVWQIKSQYMDHVHRKKYSESKARKLAHDVATGYARRKPGNPVLEAFRDRLAIGVSPDTFEIDKVDDYRASLLAYRQGMAAFREKDYQQAFDQFGVSVKFDEHNVIAWEYYGNTAQRLGDKQKGIDIWKQGLKYNPIDRNLQKLANH